MSDTKTPSLSSQQVLERIMDTKGSFVKVYWKSNPKPAAVFKNVELQKVTSAVCRAGIDYANLSVVKEGIASGERGPVQELPWGSWLVFPYTITHKDETYVRLYPSSNSKQIASSQYYVNGTEVTKEQFASYLTNSEAKKLLEPTEEDKPLCFTVKQSNILGSDLVTE